MIYVVGIGPGNPKYLTNEAEDVLFKSEFVIGFNRAVDSVDEFTEATEVKTLKEITEFLDTHRDSGKDIAVLASGDPSFFGIAEYLSKKYEIEVVPGISTVSYLAAKLKISLNEVKTISFHGREIDKSMIDSKKLMIYTDSENTPNRVSKWLKSEAYSGTIFAGFNLSYDGESIIKFNIGEEIHEDSDLNILYVELA